MKFDQFDQIKGLAIECEFRLFPVHDRFLI